MEYRALGGGWASPQLTVWDIEGRTLTDGFFVGWLVLLGCWGGLVGNRGKWSTPTPRRLAAGNVVFAEIMLLPNGMSKGCG